MKFTSRGSPTADIAQQSLSKEGISPDLHPFEAWTYEDPQINPTNPELRLISPWRLVLEDTAVFEVPPVGVLPMTALPGMTLSYSSGTVFGISKGKRLSSDETFVLSTSSAFTKAINAAWAAGTGNGAMDTGSAPAAGTLNVYVIGKTDGSLDYLVSNPAVTTPGSPVMPSGWTLKRYIGSLKTVGSAIVNFIQDGDLFLWQTVTAETNITGLVNTAQTITAVYCPTGLKVILLINAIIADPNAGGSRVRFSSLDQADISATNSVTQLGTGAAGTAAGGTAYRVRSNASAQFRARATGANGTVNWSVEGFVDRRMAFTGYE